MTANDELRRLLDEAGVEWDYGITGAASTMTANDELRRLLDEAGVEWDYGITGAASTRFNANGVELTFVGMRDGVTCSTILTPAQAIAATIGRGGRMAIPYDYDQTNIEHLRAVIVEQEATIEYLHECCKEKEVENARLRDLMYERAHVHAIQHMTEDELRVTAANALDENAKLREERDMYRDLVGLMDHPDINAQLQVENAALRELVRDYHRFADAMCAERDCDGCSQRDEGACERGVLTSRECVLGVAE